MRNIPVIALLILVTFPFSVGAIDVRAGEQPIIAAEESIVDDVYLAGAAVTHLGTVTGDLVAAGGNVVIQGPVTEDVMVLGGTITLLGPVSDDVRVAGGNVTINSIAKGDVIVFGGQVHIVGAIEGDLVAFGGTVRIDGPVTGVSRVGGGSVFLNAPFTGTVQSDSEELTLGKNTVLEGDLVYSAVREVQAEEGAIVQGKTAYTPSPDVRRAATQGVIAVLSLWLVMKFLMTLVGAFVIGLFFHKYSVELGRRALVTPIPEFLIGLAVVVVLPVVSVVLLATVIGIPLGLLGIFVYIGIVLLAHVIAPIVLGSLLMTWFFTRPIEVNWKSILLGTCVFFFIGFVPFVGWLARTFILLLSLGAALCIKWDIAKEWR